MLIQGERKANKDSFLGTKSSVVADLFSTVSRRFWHGKSESTRDQWPWFQCVNSTTCRFPTQIVIMSIQYINQKTSELMTICDSYWNEDVKEHNDFDHFMIDVFDGNDHVLRSSTYVINALIWHHRGSWIQKRWRKGVREESMVKLPDWNSQTCADLATFLCSAEMWRPKIPGESRIDRWEDAHDLSLCWREQSILLRRFALPFFVQQD